jgi:hypothetical protein
VSETASGGSDALRAILEASRGIRAEWSAKAFKADDEVVGVRKLEELYEQMKATPASRVLTGV